MFVLMCLHQVKHNHDDAFDLKPVQALLQNATLSSAIVYLLETCLGDWKSVRASIDFSILCLGVFFETLTVLLTIYAVSVPRPRRPWECLSV